MRWQIPGPGLLGTLQAMLANGIKSRHMAIAPTDERQGVGNVFDTDGLGIGMDNVEMFSTVGSDLRRHGV